MSIASEITRISGNIADAYTAAGDKGATMPATQNSDNLATTISSIPAGGGGGKYALLERVKDDTDTEIGTVCGFFTDSGDTEYAVVCLDKIYRKTNTFQMLSSAVRVNGIPLTGAFQAYETYITATKNCDEILLTAQQNSLTTAAVSEARSYSFSIGNETYYGQVPNMIELLNILLHRTEINNLDTSTGSGPSIPSADTSFWTSTQRIIGNFWQADGYDGAMFNSMITNSKNIIPILEIPNN